MTLAQQRITQGIGIILLAVLCGFAALVGAALAVMENPRWWLLAAVPIVTGPPSIAALRRRLKGAATLLAASD